MKSLNKTRQTFLALFSSALIIAKLIRFGLFLMDCFGLHSYDYISGHGKTLFDTICTILTGSSLFALLATSGLMLSLAVATPLVYAALFAQGDKSLIKAQKALIVGAISALVNFISLIICMSGVISGVQFDTIMSKSSGGVASLLMLICLFIAIASLIAAASMVLCMCVSRAEKSKCPIGIGAIVIPATLVCGLIVLLLTIMTFAQFNQASLNAPVISLYLIIDTVVNCALLIGAQKLIAKR